MSFLYTKVFFFEKSFFFGFCAWTFCVKKKKRNLNFKIHNIYWLGIQERKRTQTFNHPNHYFWAKKKFWFELLFFLITLKKKNFKSLELLKTLKKILNQEFKSIFKHKKKTQKKEYCFFFRAYFKNFVYFQKFNYKKKKVEFFLKTKHKRLFQHKIYTAIWYFREVETDVIVINQTFSIFEKKKDKFLKQSIEIISNKFFGIFKTVTNGGKGFLILHFKENILKNFKKKKRYEKKTTGISILAKFNKNENLNFCEQMSDGQVSFIFVLLLFAFREITKPKVYLFDEIDTNLDPQYNKVLSYSIKQLSSSQLQFFISTFKKSSILTGDRWFGIAIKKTGSKIEKILKKNAFGFVDKK